MHVRSHVCVNGCTVTKNVNARKKSFIEKKLNKNLKFKKRDSYLEICVQNVYYTIYISQHMFYLKTALLRIKQQYNYSK